VVKNEADQYYKGSWLRSPEEEDGAPSSGKETRNQKNINF